MGKFQRRTKKALLFVNKKKQKNFISFSSGMFQRRAKRRKKVFWFLRPDDVAAKRRSLSRAAMKDSKKNFLFLQATGELAT